MGAYYRERRWRGSSTVVRRGKYDSPLPDLILAQHSRRAEHDAFSKRRTPLLIPQLRPAFNGSAPQLSFPAMFLMTVIRSHSRAHTYKAQAPGSSVELNATTPHSLSALITCRTLFAMADLWEASIHRALRFCASGSLRTQLEDALALL